MSYALIFSGQGSQHAGMWPWLDAQERARPLLDALAALWGQPWRGAFALDGGERNAVAQPLVVGSALAAWAAVQPLLREPALVVAGYSVGELAACAAAGALEPAQALRLAQARAAAMDQAVAGLETGLLAISAVTEGQVLADCPGLECAIRIAADNNVFGGTRAALADAQRLLAGRARFKAIGARLASHTSWMRPAAPAFAASLEAAGLRPANCPVVMNASGTLARSPSALATALTDQLSRTVLWGACMEAIAERRPACVLEIGGGQALSRLWSAHHPQVPARSLDEFRSPEGVAAWVERQS